ncbi:hypothetical protein BHE74_00018928 [Ensete ventricosum]|nr:hypothetical protein BHE74_00018928 [Ensete ventricosum]
MEYSERDFASRNSMSFETADVRMRDHHQLQLQPTAPQTYVLDTDVFMQDHHKLLTRLLPHKQEEDSHRLCSSAAPPQKYAINAGGSAESSSPSSAAERDVSP